MLSNVDIRAYVERDIVIVPYSPSCVQPAGYDIRVEKVYSLQRGELQETNGVFIANPHEILLVVAMEAIWVSDRVCGTLHSRVTLVSKGFSHISTTLDPNWFGPLVVSMCNQTDGPLELTKGDRFATIAFHIAHSSAAPKTGRLSPTLMGRLVKVLHPTLPRPWPLDAVQSESAQERKDWLKRILMQAFPDPVRREPIEKDLFGRTDNLLKHIEDAYKKRVNQYTKGLVASTMSFLVLVAWSFLPLVDYVVGLPMTIDLRWYMPAIPVILLGMITSYYLASK